MAHRGFGLEVFCCIALLGWGCGGVPPGTDEPPSATQVEMQLQEAVEEESTEDARGHGHTPPGASVELRQLQAFPTSITHDRDGNRVLLASFAGTVDFGGGPVSVPGGGGGFALVGYKPHGAFKWARAFAGSASSLIGPAIDRKRNLALVVEKSFQGAIDFGGGPISAARFIVGLDPSGGFRWVRPIAGQGFFQPYQIVASRSGDITISGVYNGVVDFGQGPLASALDTAFIAQYSADGTPRWSHIFPDVKGSEATGLAVDDDGTVYLGGTFTTAFNGDGSYYGDFFLMRFTPRGTRVWSRRVLGPLGNVRRLAMHGNRVALTGFFREPFSFAGKTVTPSDGRDAFVATYSTSGAESWGWGFATDGRSIDMSPKGEVVVVGEYVDGDSIVGVPLPPVPPSASPWSLFAASFESSNGRLRWARGFPSTGIWVSDVSIGKQGVSRVVGYFWGDTDFGDGPVMPGSSPGFVLGLAR
ncbi:hypothetical protein [Corallococcus sp. Z5C101001]|uniref:hypothetical protein n=1 Tax=Corallococcus sp. Z5C101001 TaxID=2596829 RepID=UPI00117DAC0A|nr:hypothetical protein [Corallococcus sp. Z5C101001]TSC34217.1 hypothetical protein FOF48_04050 [Corallococcus sp. Z5C101001]